MPSSRNVTSVRVFVCKRQVRPKCQGSLCVNSGNMLGLHSHKRGGVGGVCRLWASGWPVGRGLSGRKDRSDHQLKIRRMCRVLKSATVWQVNRTHKSWESNKMHFQQRYFMFKIIIYLFVKCLQMFGMQRPGSAPALKKLTCISIVLWFWKRRVVVSLTERTVCSL